MALPLRRMRSPYFDKWRDQIARMRLRLQHLCIRRLLMSQAGLLHFATIETASMRVMQISEKLVRMIIDRWYVGHKESHLL